MYYRWLRISRAIYHEILRRRKFCSKQQLFYWMNVRWRIKNHLKQYTAQCKIYVATKSFLVVQWYYCPKWTNKEYCLPECVWLLIKNLEKNKWFSRKNYMMCITFLFWCCEAHKGRLLIILTNSVQPTCYYFRLKMYVVYLRNVARRWKKKKERR